MKWDKIILEELGKKIAGERKSREIIFLCSLGNLVKNADYSSFNLLVHSESSSGKDYLVKNVLKIFNPYKIISRTRISKVVLNYWKPWEKEDLKPASWDQKVLYLPDCSEDILNSDTLKLMCSEGSRITITNKKLPCGYEDIEILGKPVIIITTANSTPNKEILNRFGVVKLDESEEQTNRIHNFIPRDYGEKSLDFICKLNPCNVKIPIIMRREISKVFPKKLLRERRNFNRFLDFIKAIAVFFQEEKREYNEKCIVQDITAEWKDYDVAKEVFMNLYSGVSEIPLNVRQKEIIEIIKEYKEPIEVMEIHNQYKKLADIKNTRNYLISLTNLGILEEFYLPNTFNRNVRKYVISEEYSNKQPIILPNSEDIRDKGDKGDIGDRGSIGDKGM